MKHLTAQTSAELARRLRECFVVVVLDDVMLANHAAGIVVGKVSSATAEELIDSFKSQKDKKLPDLEC